jgi:hypothetical protein
MHTLRARLTASLSQARIYAVPVHTRRSGTATPDPDEIDISQHHLTPASQPRLPSPFAFQGNQSRPGPAPDAWQDPMTAMLQQMMSGGGMPGTGMPGVPGQQGGAHGGLATGSCHVDQCTKVL